MLSPSGWNWATIPFDLPSEVKVDIQVVPTPLVARCSDNLAWKFSSKGDFDIRSVYLLTINSSGNDSDSFSSSCIWKLSSLPRIQIFIWKCMHQSIGVKECLANRGIPIDTTACCAIQKPNLSCMLSEIVAWLNPYGNNWEVTVCTPLFFLKAARIE